MKMHLDELAAYFAASSGYAEPDDEATPLGYYYAMRLARVADLMSTVDPKSVLDVGCGKCTVQRMLPSAAVYYGVDLVWSRLHACLERRDPARPVHLAAATAGSLPVPDGTFDVVLCLGVLEYVEDVNPAVASLSRVLRPGGTLILSMLNPASPYRSWYGRMYRGNCWRTARRILHRPEPQEPRLTLIPERHMRELIEEQGRMVTQEVIYFDFNLWLAPLDRLFPSLCLASNRRLAQLADSRMRRLGSAYILKATRRGNETTG